MRLTNKYDLPEELVHVVRQSIYDPRERDLNRVALTTLIGNPFPKLLALRHWDEIEEDVSDHLWRIHGSAMHYVIEKAQKNNKDVLTEQKLELEIDGITIVTKLDLYNISSLSIQDWKNTSVWSILFGKQEEWEEQLNPYAYVLQNKGFEVNELRINAFLKDWDKDKAGEDKYPPIPFKSIKIKKWPLDKQEAYLKERICIYKKAIELYKQNKLEQVDICNTKERWAKEDKYAVYKATNKTASRVLDTLELAQEWATQNLESKGHKFHIDKRAGEDLKCLRYCNVNVFCPFYKEKYGDRT